MDLLRHIENRVPHWAPVDRSMMIGLRGSDAHGTKLENSPHSIDDVDVFSVVVQPREWYLTLENNGKKRQHWDSAGEDVDILVYDVRKLFGLLVQANPNVLNWLWNRPEDYLYVNVWGEWLIKERELFLTKQIFPRLIGYAYAQMQRMNADKKYEGYMGEKRKLLVDNFGYDVKNAAHCVRLLLMAIEIGEEGRMSTYRPELERMLIKSIKRGDYSLKEITELIEHTKERARAAEEKCDLPEKPDLVKINSMLTDIIVNF